MNLLKKILYYFRQIIKRLFFSIIELIPRNKFPIVFQIYSLFFFRFQKIVYVNDIYKFNVNGKPWIFYNKKQGLYAYGQGIENRIKELTEKYKLNNIEFEKDDVIVDCGANNGDFFLCLPDYTNYIGIEASEKVFNNLKHNVRSNKLLNLCAWDTDNLEKKFFINDEYGDSSVFKSKKKSEVLIIKTISLDTIIKDYKKIKLIKIDGEGAEPEILKGLKKNYKKVKYISVDAGNERGFEKRSTMIECINVLSEFNFEIKEFEIYFDNISILFKNKN